MERGPKVKWLKNEEKKTSLWVEEKEVLSAKGTRLAAAVLKVNVPCSVFYFEIYIPGRRMEIVETTTKRHRQRKRNPQFFTIGCS